MANVVIGKVEVAIEDVLHWLGDAQKVVLNSPHIIVPIITLFSAVDKVMVDAQVDVANPLSLVNIPVVQQQFADIKKIWPDIKAVFTAAGYKI